VLFVPIVVAVAFAAFAWPAARLAPRDLPVGVAGPAQAAQAIERQLTEEHAGAFAVHRYADEAAARAAIEDREVYGAIVATPSGPTVLTASAASPLVAQLLQQAATTPGGAAAGQAAPARVIDVVPADRDDPRGAGLAASLFPMLLAGVLMGVAVSLLSRPGWVQLAALVTGAVLTGLAAVGIAQGWLGILGGSWLVNAGVLSLTMLAIGSTVAGLTALIGRAGLPLGALLMVLVGNPFSGIATAPELLPQPAGQIGQLMPPGAGGNLLRSVAFFDGAGGGGHLTVLLVWAGLGLTAIMVGALKNRRKVAPPAPVPVANREVNLHAS
jgi:hypothetical protein